MNKFLLNGSNKWRRSRKRWKCSFEGNVNGRGSFVTDYETVISLLNFYFIENKIQDCNNCNSYINRPLLCTPIPLLSTIQRNKRFGAVWSLPIVSHYMVSFSFRSPISFTPESVLITLLSTISPRAVSYTPKMSNSQGYCHLYLTN